MRRPLVSLVAAALLLVAAGCGSSDDEAPAASGGTQQVKVGVIPILDVAPIYLGKQKGFFSSRGIELTMETGQGGAAIVPGVVSGQFQFGFSNVTSLLIARSRGLPLKVVANGVASTSKDKADYSGVVTRDDSIKTAADLAGKQVAVNTLKNIGDSTIRASVRKAGGDPSSVKFTELAFPDMPAALEAGRVDAVWVVEPFLSATLAQGGRLIASNYVDTAPDLTVAVYFTSEQLLRDNPDLAKRFTEAMNESLAYADAHPDEARQVLTTYTQIDKAVIPDLTLPKWPEEINRESVETLANLAVQDGLVTEQPDVDALLP
ncbi:MAG TPA: ABC transporter substrate-binding protein [Actinomycetota bacterium]|jgi:NitT/TauT family transport system substrate-binding protein|nr:ABC transporter substrate-binding protein [Actinomycetota bacterium]